MAMANIPANMVDYLQVISDKNKQLHFQHLIKLVLADEWIDESEVEFMQERAPLFGVEPGKVLSMIENFNPSQEVAPPQGADDHRFFLMFDMLALMLIDGDIDQREVSMCRAYAQHLKFSTTVFELLLHDVEDAYDSGLTTKEIFSRLKRSMLV